MLYSWFQSLCLTILYFTKYGHAIYYFAITLEDIEMCCYQIWTRVIAMKWNYKNYWTRKIVKVYNMNHIICSLILKQSSTLKPLLVVSVLVWSLWSFGEFHWIFVEVKCCVLYDMLWSGGTAISAVKIEVLYLIFRIRPLAQMRNMLNILSR